MNHSICVAIRCRLIIADRTYPYLTLLVSHAVGHSLVSIDLKSCLRGIAVAKLQEYTEYNRAVAPAAKAASA